MHLAAGLPDRHRDAPRAHAPVRARVGDDVREQRGNAGAAGVVGEVPPGRDGGKVDGVGRGEVFGGQVGLRLGGRGSECTTGRDGAAMTRPFRRGVWSRVGLNVGPAVPPDDVSPQHLRVLVAALIDDPRAQSEPAEPGLRA